MNLTKHLFTFFILSILAANAIAQQGEDVILKAMKDELDRNFAELKSPDLEKPFFIMYGISDMVNHRINATLGAITESNQNKFRFKTTTRLLVGDYAFNDESLDDDIFSSPTALELGLPIEDDYWGIRRSFWAGTDNVYRSAAQHFNQHKMTLKESKKTLEELPHRTFTKGSPVTLINTRPASTFNHAEWEERLRELSGIFLHYPDIEHSAVSLVYTEGHEYLVNSEGVTSKVPTGRIYLVGVAQTRNVEGELFFELFKREATTPDQLPAQEILVKEIETVIENLKKKINTDKLEEEYYGPVLLIGNSVAEMFNRSLFFGREDLMANDELASTTGYVNNSEIDYMYNKIGKSFLNESISIVAKPALKNFNGVSLLGSFEIDSEGMVPKEEIVLVENGILKTLLNNRSITNPAQTANGFADGPGVLDIAYKSTSTEVILREKLMEQAKKEGLEYALIVKDHGDFGFTDVYKIWVNDGREELLRNAVPNVGEFKLLRNILDATQKQQVVNLGGSEFNQYGGGGFEVSYIVPEAILLRDIEVQPFSLPSLKEEVFVKSPMESVK